MRMSCPDVYETEIARMNKFAAAFVFLSQGVPFIQAGEELMRSKVNPDGSFNENSYNAGDGINAINYSVAGDDIIKDVYEYYKGLIAFRKANRVLRLAERYDVKKVISRIRSGVGEGLMGFKLRPEDDEEMLVYFNACVNPRLLVLPYGDWDVYVDADRAGAEPFRPARGYATIQPLSAMVLKRHKRTEDL